MDDDLRYIIDEEKRLQDELESAKASARRRIDARRSELAAEKKSMFESIRAEYETMASMKLDEIRKAVDEESEKLRREQERLNSDTVLMKKITGRVVSLILENRA